MNNEQFIKYNGNRTKVLSCDPKASGEVVLDDSVTTICECAFQDCKEITDINIPESIAYIEEDAFKDCAGIAAVHIPSQLLSSAKVLLLIAIISRM